MMTRASPSIVSLSERRRRRRWFARRRAARRLPPSPRSIRPRRLSSRCRASSRARTCPHSSGSSYFGALVLASSSERAFTRTNPNRHCEGPEESSRTSALLVLNRARFPRPRARLLLERTSDEAETSRERALDSGIARGSTCAGRRDATRAPSYPLVVSSTTHDGETRRRDAPSSRREIQRERKDAVERCLKLFQRARARQRLGPR